MSDFRADQSPVGDQGDRPTCVAFAVGGAHEWLAADGELRSAEDAMWAAHQIGTVPGREEISVRWALEGLSAHEHASEQAWPYGTPQWPAGRPAAALGCANRRALPAWLRLQPLSFTAIREQLAAGNAVLVSLRVVPAAWRRPDATIDAEPGRKAPGNHAVLAVGATKPGEDPERAIVKNSWGPQWGRDGYGYLTRRYLESYGVRMHVLEREGDGAR